ncbi:MULTISPECIES: hypothetical protein [unclassified Mesotoga]|mgnify:CR=1 FL=1|nr:hypothetical protein [Mesotoga sp. BH458_6_3_2_1]
MLLRRKGLMSMDNVLFSSDQLVFVLKRTAVLRSEIPYKSITG